MADLTTTIHETIEQHRYAVPAGEMSYRRHSDTPHPMNGPQNGEPQ